MMYLLSMGICLCEGHTVTFSNSLLGLDGLVFLLTNLCPPLDALNRTYSPPNKPSESHPPELTRTFSGGRRKHHVHTPREPTIHIQTDEQMALGNAAYATHQLAAVLGDPSEAKRVFAVKLALLSKVLHRDESWPQLNANFRQFCDQPSAIPKSGFWVATFASSRLALERSGLYAPQLALQPTLLKHMWTLEPPAEGQLEQPDLGKFPQAAWWNPDVYKAIVQSSEVTGHSFGLRDPDDLLAFFFGPFLFNLNGQTTVWQSAIERYFRLSCRARMLRFSLEDMFSNSPLGLDYKLMPVEMSDLLSQLWRFKSEPLESTGRVQALAPYLRSSPASARTVLLFLHGRSHSG
jgi:hypothetical protein